ncbi:killer toxin [Trichoderma pleuroticola]
MHSNTAITILVALAGIGSVSGLGINCRGAAGCSFAGSGIAKQLQKYINSASDGTWFNNGQQIACSNGICAFFQGTGGGWGSDAKRLAADIIGHGCTVCGSAPFYYPNPNDIAPFGELTFNAVGFDCGRCLCSDPNCSDP